MRGRVLLVAVVAVVSLTFLGLMVPGSPLAVWLAGVLGGGGETAAPAAGPARPSPAPRAELPELRAAVGAMISPQITYLEYRHLYEILARELGRSLRFVQRRTYREINDMLAAGDVDVAWVCTGAMEELARRGAAGEMVAPVVAGGTVYHAYVIARADSGIRSLEDLRGKRFAFTDPLSLTGHKVVRRWLEERGETPESFFRETFFTHAHDNSVRAVQRGLADASSVDSLVYDFLASRYPEAVRGVRIVWESEPFPIPPIVISTRTDRALAARVRELLLTVHESEEGREVLRRIGVERFVIADRAVYFAE